MEAVWYPSLSSQERLSHLRGPYPYQVILSVLVFIYLFIHSFMHSFIKVCLCFPVGSERCLLDTALQQKFKASS